MGYVMYIMNNTFSSVFLELYILVILLFSSTVAVLEVVALPVVAQHQLATIRLTICHAVCRIGYCAIAALECIGYSTNSSALKSKILAPIL